MYRLFCYEKYFFSLSIQAKELFLEGVELERVGQHFSAIQKYKRAVQLVPDIEYRTFEDMRRNQQQQGENTLEEAERIFLLLCT